MDFGGGFFLENYSLREKVVKKSKIPRARSKGSGERGVEASVDVVVAKKLQ